MQKGFSKKKRKIIFRKKMIFWIIFIIKIQFSTKYYDIFLKIDRNAKETSHVIVKTYIVLVKLILINLDSIFTK